METIPRIFYRELQSSRTPSLRVISHNVFWFQGVPFATDNPPDSRREIVKQLCAIYKEARPDVICLQEVQNEAAAQTVSQILGMEYIFRSGGAHSQYGGAVLSCWPMEEMSLPQTVLPDRILLGVKISPPESRSFCLVNIHLPSDRQRGAEDGQKQRLKELSWVLGHAEILLGDFNETGGQSASLLREHGYTDAAQSCLADALPSNIGGGRGDQIWVSKDAINALQGYFPFSKERLALGGTEKTFLSDHLPIGCILSL